MIEFELTLVMLYAAPFTAENGYCLLSNFWCVLCAIMVIESRARILLGDPILQFGVMCNDHTIGHFSAIDPRPDELWMNCHEFFLRPSGHVILLAAALFSPLYLFTK